jgi:CheY-like chemotaxis protein
MLWLGGSSLAFSIEGWLRTEGAAQTVAVVNAIGSLLLVALGVSTLRGARWALGIALGLIVASAAWAWWLNASIAIAAWHALILFVLARRFGFTSSAWQTRPRAQRVLAVASDPVGLVTIQEATREMGWRLDSLAEPPLTIEFLRLFSPDLLCIDLALAGDPGFELCSRIRGDAKLQRTRILGIGDDVTMDALDRAERVGVDAYVKKPLSHATFIKYATALILHPSNPPFPPAGSPEAATAPRLVIQKRSKEEGGGGD